jgi:hypothetical protein
MNITYRIVELTDRQGCEHGRRLGSKDTYGDIDEFTSASKEWVFVSSGNVSVCHSHDQGRGISAKVALERL